MNKPIVLANESLVRNGDFEQGFSNWKKGLINPGWLGTASEIYEGGLIRFLKAGNESSVSQTLTVPKDPGPEARYVLRFLCETRHTEAGKLVVSIEGQSQELVISLPPGEPRDPTQDLARLNNGQPLEYKPKEYEVGLDLPFEAQDKLIVSVYSPKNEPADYTSQVCITRIKLHLHLEPAKIQMLRLDEQSLPATGLLHMCLGASASLAHRLEFVPDPENGWEGTQAALTSNDNPSGAVIATPAWGEDQPVESFWRLDCPLIGGPGPYLFQINLLNQYTAEPYPVQVSLGHHRVVFREVREAAYYPVLEYGQSVEVCVQVASYYTGQILEGLTVNWTVEGTGIQGAAVTNAEGWACFNFTPVAAGMFTIVGSVVSLYYASGVVTHEFGVHVLETDPWKEVKAVVADVPALWEEKTGYPNRGSTYALLVRLPSIFTGTDISLHWWGDSHEQLGVDVSPALDELVPVPTTLEMLWELINKDLLDGKFELSLSCSKLLSPSPKKAMSLARNLVKVGEVREANKFPVVDENESVLLRVQVVHVIASGSGDPVVNALVEWKTADGPISTVTTGAGGWASVLYTPPSAGNKVVTASIKAHADAVAVEQPFNVKAIATSPWKNEVKIFLDERKVELNTLGVLCRRGQTHTLKVVPVSGSTWIDQIISLHWRGPAPDIGLVPADLGTPKPLVVAGVEWNLVSQVDISISSLFELELHLEGVSTVRELFGRLVSVNLTEEVSLRLDQISAALDDQTFYPCLGARHRFSVLPNPLSPLVGLESLLTWLGMSAEELDATVQPALDLAQTINDGGANWMLDFTASQQPGLFSLRWEIPLLGFVAIAKPMTLGHNKVRIETWRESPVDPVVGQDPAWLWIQVFSHFTGLAVDQVPVKWTAVGSSVKPTDVKGWSGFAVAPASSGRLRVKAAVTSPYNGYQEEHSMEVRALASDPWAGLMASFDGASAQLWSEKTYFPRRKGEHMLKLWAPADSPLLNRELKLGMTGSGPAELGIRFLPEALGVPRMFHDVGMEYSFKVDDLKNGSFGLCLSSERLASLSPANAMSLGEGSQVLKISADNHAVRTLDWGETLRWAITVISVVSGRPMVGWTVIWSHPDIGGVTSVTDFYGVASIDFVPTTPGAAQLTATVGDEQYSVSVALNCFLNDPREISELIITKEGQRPGEIVEAQATVVSAFTGLPLGGVWVMWADHNDALPSTQTDVNGRATIRFMLTGSGERALTASVESGLGGWGSASVSMSVQVGPVIEVLNVAPLVVYSGESISGHVKVVSSDDGKGWADLIVHWIFQTVSIPFTHTDASGESQSSDIPTSGSGVFSLSANISGYPQYKSVDVEVLGQEAPRIYGLRWLGGRLFEVHVRDGFGKSMADIPVFWRVDTVKYDPVVTDPNGRAQIQIQENSGTLYAGIKIGVANFLREISMQIP